MNNTIGIEVLPMSTTRLPADPLGVATQDRIATVRRVRRSALVAGVATLVLAVLAGAANVAVIGGLVTKDDAAKTASDVLASSGLFRLGLTALVVAVILDVIVAWALLTFFEPVDKDLSRLAAWFRLSYAAVFAVAIGQLLGVLPLLDAGTPSAFTMDQRHTQALAKIEDFLNIWHVGLVLFGLHLVLIGYLAYRSGYVPRALGVLLVIAGAGYLVDSFAGDARRELCSQRRRRHVHRRSATHAVATGQGTQRHAERIRSSYTGDPACVRYPHPSTSTPSPTKCGTP
jgi:hypothetical protein